MEKQNNIFFELSKIDVSEFIEKKPTGKFDTTGKPITLSYLSWMLAWSLVKSRYPKTNYKIQRFENDKPYLYDEKLGYMIFTQVSINDETKECWLPVLDNSFNAMKNEQYKFKTSKGYEKIVAAATMFDINTTIMRCLAKNLAMHGLGSYIYAGHDLPHNYMSENVDDSKMPIPPKKVAKDIPTEPNISHEESIELNKKLSELVNNNTFDNKLLTLEENKKLSTIIDDIAHGLKLSAPQLRGRIKWIEDLIKKGKK